MMQADIKKYRTIIGYGIGQYYEKTKIELKKYIELDYLCDKKWETQEAPETYDGIKIIKKSELVQLKDALIIIFSGTAWGTESIRKDIEGCGVEIKHVDDFVKGVKRVTGAL